MRALLLFAAFATPLAAQPGGLPPSPTPAAPAPEATPAIAPRPRLGPTGPARPTALATEPAAVAPAAQPERLNAAVEAFVLGVWELESIPELPRASEELVFARLAFADGEMTMTTVYLDPDDGDLAGRSRRDRYFVADGQVLARDGFRTRLFDVVPHPDNPDRVVVRDVQTDVAMPLRRVEADTKHDPGLYATWRVAPPAHHSLITIAFRPDGRAVGTSDGDTFDVDYVVAGAYVIVDNRDTFRYSLSESHLVLERGDELILLARQP